MFIKYYSSINVFLQSEAPVYDSVRLIWSFNFTRVYDTDNYSLWGLNQVVTGGPHIVVVLKTVSVTQEILSAGRGQLGSPKILGLPSGKLTHIAMENCHSNSAFVHEKCDVQLQTVSQYHSVNMVAGWWYTYLSENMKVSWDDDSQN